jgi:hypothetical protein
MSFEHIEARDVARVVMINASILSCRQELRQRWWDFFKLHLNAHRNVLLRGWIKL